MARRLYGGEPLLDGLVPRLVNQQRRLRPDFSHAKPVVQLVGGKGLGKTAMLQALSEQYANELPMAYADLAAPDFGEAGLAALTEERPNASPVTNLLYLLLHKLSLRAKQPMRALRFPRLSVGLLVVTTWRPGATAEAPDDPVQPAELRDAVGRLREIVTQETPDQKKTKDQVKRWMTALMPAFPAFLPQFAQFDGLVQNILTTAADEFLPFRTNRGALSWWREQLPSAQGDSLQRLFTFVRDFRRQDDSRTGAEALLIAAFLEDIAVHYGALLGRNGWPYPLILLDNVHTALGSRLLTPLLQEFETVRRVVRPVLITTSLGNAAAHPQLRDAASWRPASDRPVGRLVRFGIPRVDRTDIKRMLGGVDYPPHTPLLVDRLSGGRAGCARTLADVVVDGLRSDGAALGEELLDGAWPEDTAPPVNRLLEQLLPDPDLRARLTLFSAALDEAAARRLWEAFHPDDSAAVRVHQAMEELDGARWTPVPWPGSGDAPPFVADRALRLLLLHRLRTASAAERWERIQLLLRTGHRTQSSPPDGSENGIPVAYLHHTLALGLVEPVVHGLHHGLEHSTPNDWMAALNIVCAAPHPPRGFTAPAGYWSPDTPCAGCAAGEPVRAQLVHRAVDRLLKSLWLQSDPLTVPCDDHIDKVESALRTLDEHHTSDAFHRAGRQWPAQLRTGVQAPDLPLPERIGA
ncbi:hypothetical protein [Streptomyces sp. NPDC001843]|uniref:hypothetical protein n=1 Tax=Streptomyces sp. NPDC001843 TaxID=3364617 RepID=UPI0036762E27